MLHDQINKGIDMVKNPKISYNLMPDSGTKPAPKFRLVWDRNQ